MVKKKKQETAQEPQKEARTYYLKKSSIHKLEQMAQEQGRKLSTILDRLIEAA